MEALYKLGGELVTVQDVVEIDICYNDYFIEVVTIEYGDLESLIQSLKNDKQKSFVLSNKTFFKKDLNSVSIVDHGLGFIFIDVND